MRPTKKVPRKAFKDQLRQHLRSHDNIRPEWFSGNLAGLKPWHAYAAVIGLYVASGYLLGLVGAAKMMLFHPAVRLKSDAEYLNETLEDVARSVAAVMLLWLAIRWLQPRGPVVGQMRGNWLKIHRVGLLSVGTMILGTLCAAGIAALVGETGDYPLPEHHSTMQAAEMISSALMAGITEEICLLALPILLLRAAGRGWWEITTVLVLVRLSFHIYYGWSSLGLGVWAALAVMLFRYTQCVLPMILVHSLRDLPLALGLFSPILGNGAADFLLVGTGVWMLIWNQAERKVDHPAPPNTD